MSHNLAKGTATPEGNPVLPEVSKYAITPPRSLVEKIANKYSVEPAKLLATLKATAFKQPVDKATGQPIEVTNEQMMALLVVANEYGLNPFTREIYAFPDRGGVVPIVGVDGWSRIINDHPQFDGMTFHAEMDDDKGKPISVTCTMYRKDRKHPTVVTEFYRECKRETPPWNSHPTRLLRHKAMIQCSRIAFGFTGIHDEDEGERIIQGDATIVRSQAIDDLNAEVRGKGAERTELEKMVIADTAKGMGHLLVPLEPVPQTVVHPSGRTTAPSTAVVMGTGEIVDAAPSLDLTGGPNLSDIISALRAAKTMDEVDAAEDLSRHMRLSDVQRAEVKTEATAAEKRMANS